MQAGISRTGEGSGSKEDSPVLNVTCSFSSYGLPEPCTRGKLTAPVSSTKIELVVNSKAVPVQC